ncbi:MAG: hypothetical protein WEA99_02885 [Brumimicrobium sp.]
MKKRKRFYTLTILMLILFSCSENRLDVNIESIKVNIEHVNVDSLYRDANLQEAKDHHKTLKSKLDDLYLFEVSQNIQKNVDTSSYKSIYDFYQSEYIKTLEKEKLALFETMKLKKPIINNGFRYLKYHFNDVKIPMHIIYMNKLFSTIHCSDSSISVGLESYMSPENKTVKEIPNNQLYQWQKDRMNEEYITRDLLMHWIQVHLFDEIDSKLAEHIVQAGKLLYILNATIPNAEERIILRYSSEDLEWAKENEKMTWDYLVKEQFLFENNDRDKANFLNEGPQTIGLPEESPDRMGQFIGYQMVKGYMSKNKALSLQKLLEEDYNSILQTYEID